MQLCKKWNVSMDYLFYEKEDGGYFVNNQVNQYRPVNTSQTVHIAARIRELKILSKEEIIDYINRDTRSTEGINDLYSECKVKKVV